MDYRQSIVGECSATVLAHTGNIWTLELCYPRIIHCEFLTHRMFSRNAQSSRATPVSVTIKSIEDGDYFVPAPRTVLKNKSGMSGGDPLTGDDLDLFYKYWCKAKDKAVKYAKKMEALGVHKNIINRILEPFSFINVVVTATEWDNFFKLRLAPDAEPNMQDLAWAINGAMGTPVDLPNFGDFHLPYITEDDFKNLTLKDSFLVSAARCARVSYLNRSGKMSTLEEDLKLANRLLKGGHMSPFENPCLKRTTGLKYYNLINGMSYRYLYDNNLANKYLK